MGDLNICVFCSSSTRVGHHFRGAAMELGRTLAARGDTLVYGGTNSGTMGALAEATLAAGGRAVGIIPASLYDKGIAHPSLTELMVTKDMRDRKEAMTDRADAFIALPGGFGTLEEVLECITLRQLRYHDKPIVLINTDGYYESLNNVFEHMYAENFARPEYRNLYFMARHAEEALAYIDNFRPVQIQLDKWA